MVWLDNSRIIAIFSVVFLHAAAGVVVNIDVGTTAWWVGNVYDSMVRWSVPVFVMISGSLLLDPKKNEPIKTFYTKRISKILIPLIFWSLFYLFWVSLKDIADGQQLSFADLSKKLASGKPYYHMWYLYMIISLYLFTPFFRKLVSNSSRSEIIIFVSLTLFLSAINTVNKSIFPSENSLFLYWFLSYIPYFFLGHLIREDEKNYSTKFLWSAFSITSVLTAIGYYLTAVNRDLESGLYFHDYLSVTVIPMSVSVMYLLKLWGKPIINVGITKKLSVLTLGIYLIHPLFLEMFSSLGYATHYFNPIWSVPITTVLVSALSLLAAYIISSIRYLDRVI